MVRLAKPHTRHVATIVLEGLVTQADYDFIGSTMRGLGGGQSPNRAVCYGSRPQEVPQTIEIAFESEDFRDKVVETLRNKYKNIETKSETVKV
jgi:hypothetical protein